MHLLIQWISQRNILSVFSLIRTIFVGPPRKEFWKIYPKSDCISVSFYFLLFSKSVIVDVLGVKFCLLSLISETYYLITYWFQGYQDLRVLCAAQIDNFSPLWRVAALLSWKSIRVLSLIAATQAQQAKWTEGLKKDYTTKVHFELRQKVFSWSIQCHPLCHTGFHPHF